MQLETQMFCYAKTAYLMGTRMQRRPVIIDGCAPQLPSIRLCDLEPRFWMVHRLSLQFHLVKLTSSF